MSRIPPWEKAQDTLAWEPVSVGLMTDRGYPVPGYRGIQRNGNGHILGVVSPQYEIVPNSVSKAALSAAMEGVGGMTSIEFGSTNGGSRVYCKAMSDRETSIRAGGKAIVGDTVQHGGILSNRHDGTGSWRFDWFDLRLTCLNGNTVQDLTSWFRVRHGANVLEKIADILPAIQQYLPRHIEQFGFQAERMVEFKPSASEVDAVLQRLWPDPPAIEGEPVRQYASNRRIEVRELYSSAETCNIPGIEGTGWALYSAITENIDYRESKRNPFSRLESSWFGTDSAKKEQALQYVLQAC